MWRIHHVVAWIALVSGLGTALVWLGVVVVSGDPASLPETIGPVVLATVAGTQLVRRRLRGEVVLVVAAVHVTLTVTLSRHEETLLAAALGIVVILAVGALLISARLRTSYAVGTSLYALVVGSVWDGPFLGASMMVVTAASVSLFMAVHAASRAAENRYRTLFSGVPVPLALQDWRPVRTRLRSLRGLGVDDVAGYFAGRPDELRALVGSVRVVDGNEAFIRMTGAGTKEAALAFWESHLDELPTGELEAHLQGMLDGEVRGTRELDAATADGRSLWIHVDWLQTPEGALHDADRLTAITDISDLKRVSEELADLLAAKDQFVASISHELRTPLTAVLGFGESLRDGAIPLEDRDDVVEMLVAEARHMADIVEDLLVAARARLGEISIRAERLDLVDTAARLAKNTEEAFDVEPAEGVEAFGDPTRVSQILRNLVVNASRYGGRRKRILFGVTPEAARVEVRDDGPGIPASLEASLFEPYVSGEARAGLTPSIGLGLWVSRELAGLMGGSLEYLREGDETVFRLTLPRPPSR